MCGKSGMWRMSPGMRIELNCAVCGNNHFDLGAGEADEGQVSCRDCGHKIGTMAELQERVAAEVLRRFSEPPPLKT